MRLSDALRGSGLRPGLGRRPLARYLSRFRAEWFDWRRSMEGRASRYQTLPDERMANAILTRSQQIGSHVSRFTGSRARPCQGRHQKPANQGEQTIRRDFA